MSLVNSSFAVNVTPGTMPPTVHVSEYDIGRTYTVTITGQNGSAFNIPAGTTATVEGTLNGVTGFTTGATISGSNVSFTLTESMTARSGKAWCKIKLTLNDEPIQTCAFVLAVDRAGVEANTVIGAPGFDEQIQDAVDNYLEEHPVPTVTVDPTLTISGAAADAKVTGDKFDDLKSAITYKADKAYGGKITGNYIQLTAGSTWNTSTGNTQSTGASNRARNDATLKTIDMKSVSVKSGYQMIVYGNNLGVGNPLTQIGSHWITSIDIAEQSYNYLFVVVRRSDNETITSDNLSDVLTINKYSELPYAIEQNICYQKTFSVAEGTNHSSKNDRIEVAFESGKEYLFYVKSSIAAQTSLFSGETGTAIATIRNAFFKYTPQSAFDSVGVFVSNNTASAIDVTFYVATDISILQRIVNDYEAKTEAINNTLNDVFLTDGFNVAVSNRDTKIAAFSDLFIDAKTTESFLFFTDPHTVNANITDEAMRKGVNAIELVFNATPTTYCICGGDWLQDGDTKAVALNRLGYIDGFMRKKFGDYYLPMLGNHDTNYQGIDTIGSAANTGELPRDALQQIWFRKYGAMYYSYKAINSRFYIFNTGIDWDDTMTDYRWEQVDWFANQLLTNDDAHSIMFLHILTNAAKATFEADVPGNVTNFASNLFEVAQKYNARGTLTLNGHTYDFSAKTGKIAFAQCGHSHYDSVVTYKDIPAILTVNATATPKFDLCYVNYVTGKYKMIRVGDGSDRTVNIVI